MGEAMVVNLFLTVRVLLVGGFLLILPYITRKGLLFGTYVGEASADRDAARMILSAWSRGCVFVMVFSLLVGYSVSLAGMPVIGNFTGTAVLLAGALAHYLRTYGKARRLVPQGVDRQAHTSVAPLVSGEPLGKGFAKLALGICLVVSGVTFVFAIVNSEGSWLDTSFVTTMFLPSLNLVISPFFALMALLTADAKLSVRGGAGGHSIEAQREFRAAYTRLLGWVALLLCALMTVLSVQIIRMRLSQAGSFSPIDYLVAGFMASVFLVFCLVNLIRLVKNFGQGGALLETGTAEAPLTNGLADNTHWFGGLFFVDREDPSVMVEKRFGLGYTFNYGNWKAVLLVGTVLVAILGLIAIAVFVALN
jgi:hypothetical protein